MTSNTTPVPGSDPSQGAPTPTTGTPTQSPSGDYDTSTTVSSPNDLKAKAPEVWNAMMQGLATNIIGQSKRDSDRFKAKWKEMLSDMEGG